MNHRGMYKHIELPVCPKCGMDSGKRMVSDTVPERYFVVCGSCGFRTKPHPNQTSATTEWSRLSKKENKT